MPELAKDEDVIDLLREQVDAGRVGVRSGAGFYDPATRRYHPVMQPQVSRARTRPA
ncbi:3-hydroxyacyl-CoA dehydrogenase [Paraburkholderia sp. GAS448]